MSATVESPMPWRRADRISLGPFQTNGLYRSSSSHSNLAALTVTGSNCISRLSAAPSSAGTGRLAPDAALTDQWMRNFVTVERPAEAGARHGMLFSNLVRGQSSGKGVRSLGISNQLNKLSRQFDEPEVPASAIPKFLRAGPHRLLSQSSDRLTDVGCVDGFASPSGSFQRHQSPPCRAVNAKPPTADPPRDPSTVESPVRAVRCDLVAELMADCALSGQLLIFDCRTFVSYNTNHVRGSLNVSCSDCISRKRLLSGRTTIGDLVSGADDAKERYRQAEAAVRGPSRSIIQAIIYDDDTLDYEALPSTHALRLVVSGLRKAGFEVYYMHGGLKAFHKKYSCLCSQPGLPPTGPLVYCPSTPSVECQVDNAKISQILPFLYVGNEHDAGDRSLLKQLGIGHVLNVTSHVPLHFESEGVQYIRLSASDSGIQNLRQYFDEAITFIDDVRSAVGRVLIHCQAGVSRSSTIAIAYIMARSSLSMLDAFRFVKSRRPIVAPNFNFMGQLLDFETALKEGDIARHPLPDIESFIADCSQNDQQNWLDHD